MKATRKWTITFAGPLDDDARRALDEAADTGTVSTDERGRHRIESTGASAEVAIGRVREALGARADVAAFEAEPVEEEE